MLKYTVTFLLIPRTEDHYCFPTFSVAYSRSRAKYTKFFIIGRVRCVSYFFFFCIRVSSFRPLLSMPIWFNYVTLKRPALLFGKQFWKGEHLVTLTCRRANQYFFWTKAWVCTYVLCTLIEYTHSLIHSI